MIALVVIAYVSWRKLRTDTDYEAARITYKDGGGTS